MAKKNIPVEIPPGYFISWFVTTQVVYSVTVSLKDSGCVYFTKIKKNTRIDPPLALGSHIVKGRFLTLEVDVPHALELFGTPHTGDILTDEGIIAGKEFILCLGADKAGDDVAVSIIGWLNYGN